MVARTLLYFAAAVITLSFLVLVVFILWRGRFRAGAEWFTHFQKLAAAYKGEIRLGSSWPVLHLRRPGFEAVLEVCGPEGRRKTELRFSARPELPYAGHLHLVQEGIGSSMAQLFGELDFQIGDGEFDGLYEIRGYPETFVRQVLGTEGRGLIRTVGRRGDLSLTISPRLLQLRLGGMVGDVADLSQALDTLLSCALQIAESLPHMEREGGVVVLEARIDLSDTSCLVCGTSLHGEIVECMKCSTLHHHDCWEFNGRCSTFACRSISSRKAVLRT